MGYSRRRRIYSGMLKVVLGSVCLVAAMLPRRARFDWAAASAWALRPLVRRSRHGMKLKAWQHGSCEDVSLNITLAALGSRGVTFDPRLSVSGSNALLESLKTRGVLLLGVHGALVTSVLRHLHDQGVEPVIVADSPRFGIMGTGNAFLTLQPSPTYMLRVRTALREQALVCAMVDRKTRRERRSIEIATPKGPIKIADPLIQVGLKTGAQVAFVSGRSQGWNRIAITISLPPPSEVTPEAFVRFVMGDSEARDENRTPRAASGNVAG